MVAHFTLRTREGKWVFSGKNTRFDDSFDVTKCLQQIEKPDLLHVCAYSNEQPSNLKTMVRGKRIGEIYQRIKVLRQAELNIGHWTVQWTFDIPMDIGHSNGCIMHI